MASQAEIEAASRAYLDFEPKEGEEIWSRVESAMKAALEAAERVRAAPKKPVTIAELDAILNSEDDQPIEINPDGSITLV